LYRYIVNKDFEKSKQIFIELIQHISKDKSLNNFEEKIVINPLIRLDKIDNITYLENFLLKFLKERIMSFNASFEICFSNSNSLDLHSLKISNCLLLPTLIPIRLEVTSYDILHS